MTILKTVDSKLRFNEFTFFKKSDAEKYVKDFYYMNFYSEVHTMNFFKWIWHKVT